MNVCNGGTPITVFREPPKSRLAPDRRADHTADREWLDHCRSREFAERAAAKRATCSRAREVHQELAQAYARMISRATAKRASSTSAGG
jgi:hypothetical protein